MLAELLCFPRLKSSAKASGQAVNHVKKKENMLKKVNSHGEILEGRGRQNLKSQTKQRNLFKLNALFLRLIFRMPGARKDMQI